MDRQTTFPDLPRAESLADVPTWPDGLNLAPKLFVLLQNERGRVIDKMTQKFDAKE